MCFYLIKSDSISYYINFGWYQYAINKIKTILAIEEGDYKKHKMHTDEYYIA